MIEDRLREQIFYIFKGERFSAWQENTETERERQREGKQQIHIQRNTKIQITQTI